MVLTEEEHLAWWYCDEEWQDRLLSIMLRPALDGAFPTSSCECCDSMGAGDAMNVHLDAESLGF